jgi:signal transduction histidine kinase
MSETGPLVTLEAVRPTSADPEPEGEGTMIDSRWRPLALDVPLGVLVGMVSVFAARFAAYAAQDPRYTGFDGPPWGHARGHGFGQGPGFARPDLTQSLGEPYTWAAVLWAAILGLGIAFRRVRPRTGYAVSVVGVTGYLAVGLPFGPALIAPALGLVAMATRMSVRQWVPWTVLLAPMLWAGFVSQPALGFTDAGLYSTLVLLGAAMIMPALFATLRRNRIDASRRTRELELRRAAYSERLRIARDVHDLIGHSLSVINMQAGVALYVLDKQHATARTGDHGADDHDALLAGVDHRSDDHKVIESLQAIRSTSKTALDELRTTLGVFRGEAGDERSPVAGLARLPELAESMRAAGLEVLLNTTDVAGLPGPVDSAAYRIVQEALTNVARHAPDATATVTIRRSPERLVIDVVDDGPGGPVPVDSRGHGLIGMAERARSVGGSVVAGPLPSEGFGVHAEFPIMVSGSATA